MNIQVPAAEFKRKLGEYLGRVSYRKERIIVTRRGRPIAQLCPIDAEPLHLGQVKGWLDDDDPFFSIIEGIVADRDKHTPRSESGS